MSGPRVFLSYSNDDRQAAVRLSADLGLRGLQVWRDHDNLRVGDNWPAALGEAIADQDGLLLLWSQAASKSHFVRFEWTTAFALKKPILICRLDGAPVHPSLAAIQTVAVDRAVEEVPRASLWRGAPTDPARRAAVFDTLGSIGTQDAGEAARIAQGDYERHGWILDESSRRDLRDYLRGLWADLAPVPILAVTGSDVGRRDVILPEVYTALDTTTVLFVRNPHVPIEPGEESKLVSSFLRVPGDPEYLARLKECLERGLQREEPDDRLSDPALAGSGRPLSAVQAAAANRRLVLLGPPGSGKSSFARFLALCFAGEILERLEGGTYPANLAALDAPTDSGAEDRERGVDWPHGPLVPVFIELRRFAASDRFPGEDVEGNAEHFLTYIENRDDARVPPALASHLREMLADGRAIVILDGLDETPRVEERRNRLRNVVESLARKYPASRILVTSRPYAYETNSPWRLDGAGFEQVTLAPFNDHRIDSFIRNWCEFLKRRGQLDADRADQLVAAIGDAVRRERYLRPLVERPLMLTMLADLFASGRVSISGGRAALYERSVELLFDRWNEVKGTAGGRTLVEQIGLDRETVLHALEELAYEVHGTRGEANADAPAEISAAEVWDALNRDRPRPSGVNDADVIDFLHMRSGLLLAEGPRRYRFPHRSYQEFLAACRLSRKDFPGRVCRDVDAKPELWREVVQFVAARMAPIPYAFWGLMARLVPSEPPATLDPGDRRFALALLAGLALRETGRFVGPDEEHVVHLDRIRSWLERALVLGALGVHDRVEAGRVLGILGDHRLGVGLRPDGLPDIDWVTVPAGHFTMGSDEHQEDEKPAHTVSLAAYRIGRMPVTNLQFQAFVDDGGYTDRWDACWTVKGRASRNNVKGPDSDLPAPFLLANHPRVGVSWFEAQAFARWLGKKLGLEIRPPTEAEWEQAARGSDGCTYPWGEEFGEGRCNSNESGIGSTSAVGCFPDGASPQGTLDMAGNVWEWTTSQYRRYPYDVADGREGVDGDARRVLRGGSWNFIRSYARAAYRDSSHPGNRDVDIGFRVVCSSPISQ